MQEFQDTRKRTKLRILGREEHEDSYLKGSENRRRKLSQSKEIDRHKCTKSLQIKKQIEPEKKTHSPPRKKTLNAQNNHKNC